MDIVCRCFSEESHAKQFLSGEIRMMSLHYYRKCLEDRGIRKDPFEGTQKFWQGDCTIAIIDGVSLTGIDGLINVRMWKDEYEKNTKILCCTGITRNNGMFINLDNLKRFDMPYCVLLVKPDEFLKRFQSAAKGLPIDARKVRYIDAKTYNGDVGPFMKTNDYEWQNEYRITLSSLENDPFVLNLGNIEDIAMLKKTDDVITKLKNVEMD